MTFHCPLALFRKLSRSLYLNFVSHWGSIMWAYLHPATKERFISLGNGRHLETLLTWNYAPRNQNPRREVHHFSTGTVSLPRPPWSSLTLPHEPTCKLWLACFRVVTMQTPWYQWGWELGHIQRLELRGHSKLSLPPSPGGGSPGTQLIAAHAQDQKRRSLLAWHAGHRLRFSFHRTSAGTPVTPGPPVKLNPVNSV